MKFVRMAALMFLFVVGFGTLALAAGPNPVCPDADADGICNGVDPDYVPVCGGDPNCPDDDGDGVCNCEDPDYVCETCPNPDCPDADGDGICNGQDPDYVSCDDPLLDRLRIRLRTYLSAVFGF